MPALAEKAPDSFPPTEADRITRAPRPWVLELLGVLWVLVAPLAMLLPALVHGVQIGPFDLLAQHGLFTQGGVISHRFDNVDQLDAMVPWTMLSWTEVHHGVLPLWNPYNGVGMPLAFNWQSAPFGVPNLLGYLVPLRYAYTVAVMAMLMISGAGAYLMGRVLKLGVLASVMAGTVYELSGPITGWLGFPLTTVMSWAGWLFALAQLIIAGRHRARDIALFAVVFACAVYGGQPEAMVVLVLTLAIFLVIVILFRARSSTSDRRIIRPIGDLAVAAVAGGALAAPLALPGLQLAGLSVRQTASGINSLAAHELAYIVFQGYDGLPIAGSYPFGGTYFYNQTAAYVGIIAVVMAVVAVGVRWRRPEVVALAVATVAMIGITFLPGIATTLDKLPGVGGVNWLRALMTMAFGFAILAGVGLDALVRGARKARIRRWVGGSFVAAALGLASWWLFDRGHIIPGLVILRNRSFIWPTVDVAVGLIVVAALSVLERRRRRRPGRPGGTTEARTGWLRPGWWAGLTLLTFETIFLVVAGAPLVSSSSQGFPSTPAVTNLQRAVGTATVGFGGTRICQNLGILPSVNDVYGVRELGIYDPIIPKAYYQAWQADTGQPGGIPPFNEFCPVVGSVATARQWGVAYVLEPHGTPGPIGSVFDTRVGDEDLYRVPGAARATLTPVPTGGGAEQTATAKPVTVDSKNPAKWTMVTDAASPQLLRLRLTNVPGWKATIDGRPLALEPYSGIMMQATVPAGRHTVELTYWPTTFTLGLVLAACSAAGLVVAVTVDHRRRRRRRVPGTTAHEGG
jgi:hypothetical protein